MIRDKTSARKIRWMLNLWPPFFFQGIHVQHIDPAFRVAEVDVKRSIFTRNIMGTTFGGAMMAAADPLSPILYWRSLANEGYSLDVWLRKQESNFVAPADQTVRMRFCIDAQQLEVAREGILRDGRVDLVDEVEAVLPAGEVAARFRITSSFRPRSSGSSPIRGPQAID